MEAKKISEVLLNAYRKLNLTTPLYIDCGELCDHYCCQGDDSGMWLLPGEQELLQNEPGYRFVENETDTVLICADTCRREMRPYACRIFPLFPLVRPRENGKGYNIELIIDPIARRICPLAQSEIHLRPMFRYLVRKVTRELIKDPDICAWFVDHSQFLEGLNDIYHSLKTDH